MERFLASYVRLYGKRMDENILETRCLDDWAAALEIDEHPPTVRLSLRERLRIRVKLAFRTDVRHRHTHTHAHLRTLCGAMADSDGAVAAQHAYVSLFFRPLLTYTRTQRLTVVFSVLFASMCGTCYARASGACACVCQCA
jgi:hypothetical protein